MTSTATQTEAKRPVLQGPILLVFAIATGAIVANLYYCQPILPEVAKTFHRSTASVAFVVTATQIGYAAGLALVVPLGDLMRRKRLVPLVIAIAAASCLACALAPTLTWFLVASVIIGVASVGGQIMIPFVADFAPPERRARSVARLMSGLLTGILIARTLSGAIAQAFGWRAVFFVSAIAMVVLCIALALVIPSEPDRPKERYRALLAATVRLMATEPLLRRRSLLGALAFGTFSVLWTSLAWQLSRPPFSLNSLTIGLFGIAGITGVGAANIVGRYADQQRSASITVFAAIAIVVAFVCFIFGASSLVAIIVGVVLLDLGTQGVQLSNQSAIYALNSGSRSRITSAYMFSYFLGGTAGSALAGVALEYSGWRASSLIGLGIAIAASAIAINDFAHHRRQVRSGALQDQQIS